jgi:hypothetical protein
MLGLMRLVLALCLFFGLALPSRALGWASQEPQAIAEAAQGTLHARPWFIDERLPVR